MEILTRSKFDGMCYIVLLPTIHEFTKYFGPNLSSFSCCFIDSEKSNPAKDENDSQGSAARKGVLVSFRTGKITEIPEKDTVSTIFLMFIYAGKELIFNNMALLRFTPRHEICSTIKCTY